MEKRIQKLINVYCSHMFSADSDAGWHAPSQLEALITASMAKKSGGKKQITARVSAGSEQKGNDSSNDKMVKEMQFVRNKHFDFEFAKILLSKIEIKSLLALIAKQYLTYVYKREHTELEVAEYLQVTEKTVYNRKKSAMILLCAHMELIEEFKKIKAA